MINIIGCHSLGDIAEELERRFEEHETSRTYWYQVSVYALRMLAEDIREHSDRLEEELARLRDENRMLRRQEIREGRAIRALKRAVRLLCRQRDDLKRWQKNGIHAEDGNGNDE